jgi:hypothetical protein
MLSHWIRILGFQCIVPQRAKSFKERVGAFPPSEKLLYVPAELIDLCNLFGIQVKAVGGNPILLAGHPDSPGP